MTREEHIENLKAMASDMPSDKCADWIESLMAGVKALEQVSSSENSNKWIPLDEKEPKDGQLIFVTLVNMYDKRYVQIAEFREEVYRKYDGKIDQRYYGFHSVDDIYSWGDKAVAWMPLPEPYKAEGSEE